MPESLTFRRAQKKDALTLWHLANSPTVRKQALNPRKIPLKEHRVWYQKKLDDPFSRLYVFEKKACFAGFVRFDPLGSGVWIVGIAVHHSFRHRGLSKHMLQLACSRARKELPVQIFRAHILETNTASRKTFTTNHFEWIKKIPGKNGGRPCLLYEKKISG